METRKLYYEDCHLEEFSATVTGCRKSEKGWCITLDATAFYPEGGGQACDLGTLNGASVLDVQEQGEAVVHLCDRALPVGSTVTGRIDWQRRFDLMQQHTGEHIVSGIIHKMYGWHNVGFHVGADTVTIDFDGPIPRQGLADIEQQANQALWQNLPVRCWYPAEAELPNMGYRSKKALPWPVRVVEVPGFDKCACCGVHVAHTGEIGMIKLLSCVKFHQGVRIEMACGSRAFALLSKVWEQNLLVSQAFSAKILETGDAARRINEALASEKYRAAGLEKQIFDSIAKNYANRNSVLHIQPSLPPSAVRELADRIAGHCNGVAAVLSGEEDLGYSLCMICKTGDIKDLGNRLCAALNARGGGKAGSFQGSVKATLEEIQKFFQQVGFDICVNLNR